MDFELVSPIVDVQTIATRKGLRERIRLRKLYGGTKWRKLKGIARVQLRSGRIRVAEVHWYEAHGIGKRELKIKLPFLD